MSVLICVPTYETIATETYKALWELSCSEHELMFDTVKGYDCALARIKACEKAINYKADWLLMVDSDTVPPRDALDNMLSHDVDVCLGYYQFKTKRDGETCLWKLGNGNWSSRFTGREMHTLEAQGTNLVKVSGGGMGCCLIRVSVLERIPKPWFRWIVNADGSEVGEDVYFFRQCMSQGIDVFADTRVACGHAYRTLHQI